jgi:putative oxidoreductase
MNTIVRKLPSVARVLLGFVFTVFGLNGFLHFIPQPPMSGPPADFFMALFATGYMVPLIMGTELVAGVLLLAGRFVPLALTLLAPVVVNILGFHTFLVHGGFAMPLVVLAGEIYLAWVHRDAYAALLRAKSASSSARFDFEKPSHVANAATR